MFFGDRLRLRFRLGYSRVWCQSRLFPPPPKGSFPPVWLASASAYPPNWRTDNRPHGLVALGGVITEETLLAAYAKGIHPFCDQDPIQWVAFNPRMVLFFEKMRYEKKLRRVIRSGRFQVTFDTAFEEVVRGCSDRVWTWLVPERIKVAVALHQQGRAHSVEVWNHDGELVGGIIGVDMGRIFISESTFHVESNAGKVADAYLYCHLQHWGYALCDAEAYTKHLELMGFEEIPRREYVHLLRKLAGREIRYGRWNVDESLDVSEWIPASPGSQIRNVAAYRRTDAK